MDTIGQRITFLMKQKGITNVELAAKLDIAPSYMSKFKTDARRPNVYQIDKIAQILGTTTDYLLGNNVADLPFYTNFQRDEKQSTSLMNGLRSDRNFALFNQWNTIKNIEKDDMLVFQWINDGEKPSFNDVILVNIYNNSNNSKQLVLGRFSNKTIYFDNGLPPITLNEGDEIIGRLVRLMRYFN